MRDAWGEEHWAPPALVLAGCTLTHAGTFTAGPADVRAVVASSVPTGPGVFALVQSGTVRFLGSSGDLRNAFGRRRAERHRRGRLDPALESMILHHTRSGRLVDLYLLQTEDDGHRTWFGAWARREAPAVDEALDQVLVDPWDLPLATA